MRSSVPCSRATATVFTTMLVADEHLPPWRCRFGTRRLPITRSSCGLLSEHVPLLRRNGPQYFAYADFDGYRALIIKHEQCVSAFRSLWSCFPRVPADSPLHSDAMGAVK